MMAPPVPTLNNLIADVIALIELGDKASCEKKWDAAIQQYENALLLIRSKPEAMDYPLQNRCLCKLGDIFLQKDDYKRAASCYNAALVLHETYIKSNATALYKCLAIVELEFINKNKEPTIQSPSIDMLTDKIKVYRSLLRDMRLQIQKQLSSNDSKLTILTSITAKYLELIKLIDNDSIEQLNMSVCDNALVMFGSGSQNLMCPYSDVDFGRIITDSDEKTKQQYKMKFSIVSKLMEIKIINCGETEFPIFRLDKKTALRFNSKDLRNFNYLLAKEESPTPSGFSIDPAGLSPLGYLNEFNLILTVDELITLNGNKKLLTEYEHLATAIKTVSFVNGKKSLVEKYQTTLFNFLNNIISGDTISIRQQQALILLETALIKFKPPLNQQKEYDRYFQIKKELYRLVNIVIECLTLFYGVKSNLIQQRLEELVKLKILRDDASTSLLRAIEKILGFRINVQLFNKDEIEHVHHSIFDQRHHLSLDEQKKIYQLSEMEIDDLFLIYQTLLPLHRVMQAFCYAKGDASALRCNKLFDEGPQVKAETLQLLCRFKEAKEYFEKSLAINPDNIECLIGMGETCERLAQFSDAVNRFQRAEMLINRGNNHYRLVSLHIMLGDVFRRQGKLADATDSYDLAKNLIFSMSDTGLTENLAYSNTVYLACLFCSQSQMCLEDGKINEAISNLKSALEIAKNLDVHVLIPVILNNLAAIYRNEGLFVESQNLLLEAMQYQEKTTEVFINPTRLNIYANLMLIYKDLGRRVEAEYYFVECEKLEKMFYLENHPDIACTLLNMGLLYKDCNQFDLAVQYIERSLKMFRAIYENVTHHDIIEALTYLAVACDAAGDLPRAKNLYLEALKLCDGLPEKINIHRAQVLNHYGTTLREISPNEAVQLLEQSYNIYKNIYGNQINLAYSQVLNDLGCTYCTLKRFNDAHDLLEKARNARQNMLKNNEPNIDLAQTLNNLGFCCLKKGLLNEALKHHLQALRIYNEYYDNNRDILLIAHTYVNLANVYEEQGDYESAIKARKDANGIYRNIYKDTPNLLFAKNMLYLGIAYKNSGKHELALKALLEADIKLQAISPNTKVCIERAELKLLQLDSLTEVEIKLGKIDDAIRHLYIAYQTYNELYKKDKKYGNLAADRIFSLAEIYFEIKDYKNSYACYKMAFDLYSKLNIQEKIRVTCGRLDSLLTSNIPALVNLFGTFSLRPPTETSTGQAKNSLPPPRSAKK